MRELSIEKRQEYLELLHKIKKNFEMTVDAIVYYESDIYSFFYLIAPSRDEALKALGYEIITWDEFDSEHLTNSKMPKLMKGDLMYERDMFIKHRLEDLKFNACQISCETYFSTGKHYLYKAKSLYFDMYQDYENYVSEILFNIVNAVACLNLKQYDEMTSLLSQVRSYEHKPLDFYNRIEEISHLNFVVVHRLLEVLIIDVNRLYIENTCLESRENHTIRDLYDKFLMACEHHNYFAVYYLASKLEVNIKKVMGDVLKHHDLPSVHSVIRTKDYPLIQGTINRYFDIYSRRFQ